MNLLTTAETASILGVSGATVRNWTRAGHLTPATSRPIAFRRDDIFALKERIRTNRFNRLRQRANKSATDIIDPEAHDARILGGLAEVIRFMAEKKFQPEQGVYSAAVYYLEAMGEIVLHPGADEAINFDRIDWKRPSVRKVMLDWLERIGAPIIVSRNRGLRELFLRWNKNEDRLGLLYQGLTSVGKKSQTGAYFTPGHIIDAVLADMGRRPESFLDPCCGTGRYLLRAARKFGLEPDRLYGFDSDPAAVDIARINLLLQYPDSDFSPNVRCLDSLRDLANGEMDCDTNRLLESVDAIATNPPWGACKNQTRNRYLVELIRSGESFSLFIEKSLRLLRPGGVMSFLLPESMLKIKTHADLRRLLLKETRIRKIAMLGKIFSGVYTPVIRLDAEKVRPERDWEVEVEWGGSRHRIGQDRFAGNVNHALDVTVTPSDARLLDKIYGVPHETLKGNADWALGIVTGDNKRLLLESPAIGTEPILRGRDLLKYAYRPPRCHIVFQPENFQQAAPTQYYRSREKLVYRFVSDKLVFAYDAAGLLTLNSANILIPRLPGYSVKAALAFLNSSIFQFVFAKRFRTRKVLRGDLETLPFPNLADPVRRELERMVNRCMEGDYQPAEEVDYLVSRIFGLDRADLAAMAESMEKDRRLSTHVEI